MNTKIIYHDFRNPTSLSVTPETSIYMDAALVAAARRWTVLNRVANGACIALCGVCVAASIFIFSILFAIM